MCRALAFNIYFTMKVFVALLAVLAVAQAASSYGYLRNVGIPTAEKYLASEQAKIAGGSNVPISAVPWQAGVLATLPNIGQALCGGALISSTRVVTAAFCWYDGTHTASKFTIVLGSEYVFYGGVRIDTEHVVLHSSWEPSTLRNNIAVAYLPLPVSTSSIIAPVALPTTSDLSDTFVDRDVSISGFGVHTTGGSLTAYQSLYIANSQVLTNFYCLLAYPSVTSSNICTSGNNGVGICSGDYGTPLVTYRANEYILIGIASFYSNNGCEIGTPSVFTRVTSFIDFLNENL